jgi:hypothetical protein
LYGPQNQEFWEIAEKVDFLQGFIGRRTFRESSRVGEPSVFGVALAHATPTFIANNCSQLMYLKPLKGDAP